MSLLLLLWLRQPSPPTCELLGARNSFAWMPARVVQALCQVDVPACAISEFWRFCEQRGYRTKLEPPSTAALRELGLEVVAGVRRRPSLDS